MERDHGEVAVDGAATNSGAVVPSYASIGAAPPTREYETLGVVAVAVSPDGGQVAFGVKVNTTYQARLYRIADGELLASFHGLSTSTSAVAFTPDGRRLVLAGGDASIRTNCLP